MIGLLAHRSYQRQDIKTAHRQSCTRFHHNSHRWISAVWTGANARKQKRAMETARLKLIPALRGIDGGWPTVRKPSTIASYRQQ
jgi:hypothetical protein